MKEKLNEETPRWFTEWVNNHFWHLTQKVNLLLWGVGIIAGAVLAKFILDFFWS